MSLKATNSEDVTKRIYSRMYTLNNNLNNETVSVCKRMFLDTLGISEQMVKAAFIKKINEQVNVTDGRGKSAGTASTMATGKTDSLIDHINTFARVESHYLRKDSRRQYLEETLSLNKMFKLYIIWTKENNKPVSSRHHYYDIFNTRFNISFFRSKTDQCTLCERYENSSGSDKQRLENEYKLHLIKIKLEILKKQMHLQRRRIKVNTYLRYVLTFKKS